MAKVSVEDLCRYMDGEMPADEHRRTETLLSEDEESRALLEELRTGDALARQSYAGFNLEPPAEALSKIESFGRQPQSPAPKGRAWLPFALAASLVIAIVGAPAGYWLGGQKAETRIAEMKAAELAAEQEMESAIDRALETLVSGESLPWRSEQDVGQGVVTPVRTFQNHDGRWCREFTLLGEAAGEAVHGRRWQVMLEIYGDHRSPSL